MTEKYLGILADQTGKLRRAGGPSRGTLYSAQRTYSRLARGVQGDRSFPPESVQIVTKAKSILPRAERGKSATKPADERLRIRSAALRTLAREPERMDGYPGIGRKGRQNIRAALEEWSK